LSESERPVVHVLQRLLLDGFRILKDEMPPEIATDELDEALDRAIAQLEPLQGLALGPNAARLYGLAHGLRITMETVLPYMKTSPVDAREFPWTLLKVENALLRLREKELTGRPLT